MPNEKCLPVNISERDRKKRLAFVVFVTICFMFKRGFHSFVLIKVISFVGDGFSYFLLFEHSLRVAGHSC